MTKELNKKEVTEKIHSIEELLATQEEVQAELFKGIREKLEELRAVVGMEEVTQKTTEKTANVIQEQKNQNQETSEAKKERILNMPLGVFCKKYLLQQKETARSRVPRIITWLEANSYFDGEADTFNNFFKTNTPYNTYRGFGKGTENLLWEILAVFAITKEDWKEIYKKGLE